MSNVMVDGLLSSLLGKYTVKDLEYMVNRNVDFSAVMQQYLQSQLVMIRMMNSIAKYQITFKETMEYLSLKYPELYKYVNTNDKARYWLSKNISLINKIII